MDHYEENLKKEKAYRDQCGVQAQTPMVGLTGECNMSYRPTPRQEAEKNKDYHSQEAHKAAAAVEFFQKHPEFSEFIQLIRTGSIGI